MVPLMNLVQALIVASLYDNYLLTCLFSLLNYELETQALFIIYLVYQSFLPSHCAQSLLNKTVTTLSAQLWLHTHQYIQNTIKLHRKRNPLHLEMSSAQNSATHIFSIQQNISQGTFLHAVHWAYVGE